MTSPRLVVVHRTSMFDQVVAEYGTAGQAAFMLAERGRSLDPLRHDHELLAAARAELLGRVPSSWRTAVVERADLPRYLPDPEDVVVVVGQDGLVANTAKYLHDQPVFGVDPVAGPQRSRLALSTVDQVARHLADGLAHVRISSRTMVAARTADGQRMDALNEIFIGHPSHQSARYELSLPAGGGSASSSAGSEARSEAQSSSGVVVGTGTGATGWLASLALTDPGAPPLPDAESSELAFFVREAWPSPGTGTALTNGLLEAGSRLLLQAACERLVVFGDGIESDRITLSWGQTVSVTASERVLRLAR